MRLTSSRTGVIGKIAFGRRRSRVYAGQITLEGQCLRGEAHNTWPKRCLLQPAHRLALLSLSMHRRRLVEKASSPLLFMHGRRPTQHGRSTKPASPNPPSPPLPPYPPVRPPVANHSRYQPLLTPFCLPARSPSQVQAFYTNAAMSGDHEVARAAAFVPDAAAQRAPGVVAFTVSLFEQLLVHTDGRVKVGSARGCWCTPTTTSRWGAPRGVWGRGVGSGRSPYRCLSSCWCTPTTTSRWGTPGKGGGGVHRVAV
eukprot:362468-Chlamydomonas_euryale.AAC.2